MDTPDSEMPGMPIAVASTPPKPEVAEPPAEPHPPVVELDPPHESGYGFGV
jgi:hypothetical protein